MSGRWYGSDGKTRHRPCGPGQPTSGFGDSGEQLIVCYADSMTSTCLFSKLPSALSVGMLKN